MDDQSEKNFKRFLREAQEVMFPKLKSSRAFIGVISGDPNAQQCLEIGAAVLFDKPIILNVPDKNLPISLNLRKVATNIIYGTDDTAQRLLQMAIENIVKEKRAN